MTSSNGTTLCKCAIALIDKADARLRRARQIVEYRPDVDRPKHAAEAYAKMWPAERVAEFKKDQLKACRIASAKVAASFMVHKIDRMAKAALNLPETPNGLHDANKICSALYAVKNAVFTEAYGRAMPKKWRIIDE